MKTTQGTHSLYRSFGGNKVDEPNPQMRRVLVEQLAAYYPDVTAVQVERTSREINGSEIYEITIQGE